MRDVAELNFYVVERLTFSGKILFFRFFSFSYRAVKKATGFHEVHHCHNIIATDFLEMVTLECGQFLENMSAANNFLRITKQQTNKQKEICKKKNNKINK